MGKQIGRYKILDCNGVEMPDHYSGRGRTYKEAKIMIDKLNKNGGGHGFILFAMCSSS